MKSMLTFIEYNSENAKVILCIFLQIFLFVSFADKWPLMNPNELVFILITYLLFVLKIGPVLMEKRQPLQLNRVLVVYNLFKIANSSLLAYRFLLYVIDFGLFPRNCEYGEKNAYLVAILYWKYMVTKVLDLVDTIFFVVRKKNSQITFLHIYHHVFMVVVTWFCLKYDPTDHWSFMAMANSFIHVVMYAYYAMSALGPNYAKYLWWKKYLTILQLIQFALIMIHMLIQINITQCPMRTTTFWAGLSNLALFMCLFTDFYKKRYRSKLVESMFACNSQHID